jgi:NhaP-type Na+/H+ or K+/H+ antiporter
VGVGVSLLSLIRQPLGPDFAVIVGLLLGLGGIKCVNYAVDQTKIIFVLLAVPLIGAAIAALLYASGVAPLLFPPYPHDCAFTAMLTEKK